MKKSELKKQWEQELKRVQRLINQAKKQGLEFDFDPLPRTPKTVTERHIQRLRKIELDDILKRGRTTADTGLEPPVIEHPKSKQLDQPTAPRKSGTHKQEPKHPRRPKHKQEEPKKTPEELHEIRKRAAKKAAQTRKQQEQADPELAKKRKEQRVENLRKGIETMKEKEDNDPQYAERMKEMRSKRAKKASETRAINKEDKEELEDEEVETEAPKKETKPEPKQDTPVEPQPAPATTPTDDQEIEQYEYEYDKDYWDTPEEERGENIIGVDPITGEAITEKEKDKDRRTDYQKFLDMRNDERENLSTEISHLKTHIQDDTILQTPLDFGEKIVDTIETELSHAVNEEIADYLQRCLDDAIDTHKDLGQYDTWLKQVAEYSEEVTNAVYNIIDDSNSERVKTSALNFLMIIYGSFGDIPPSALEDIEQLTEEFLDSTKDYYRTQQRRLVRKKKLRERYST